MILQIQITQRDAWRLEKANPVHGIILNLEKISRIHWEALNLPSLP